MSKFCQNCGTQLNDDAVFCTNCGSSVSAPNSQAYQPQNNQPNYGYGYNPAPAKPTTNMVLLVISGGFMLLYCIYMLANAGGYLGFLGIIEMLSLIAMAIIPFCCRNHPSYSTILAIPFIGFGVYLLITFVQSLSAVNDAVSLISVPGLETAGTIMTIIFLLWILYIVYIIYALTAGVKSIGLLKGVLIAVAITMLVIMTLGWLATMNIGFNFGVFILLIGAANAFVLPAVIVPEAAKIK